MAEAAAECGVRVSGRLRRFRRGLVPRWRRSETSTACTWGTARFFPQWWKRRGERARARLRLPSIRTRSSILRPEQAPRLLTPMPERLRLLAGTGIDAVAVLPFDAALAGLSARDFAGRILAGALGVRALHEGHSFRFGRGAEAGIEELKRAGRGVGICGARARGGAGAWAGGFELGDSGAGGRGRYAAGAMDAGAAVCSVVDAGAGTRDWDAAAGSHGEPGGV